MHYSSEKAGEFFAKLYGKPNFTVLDVGGADYNGSIKAFYANLSYAVYLFRYKPRTRD
jgi:hypothetical protein